MKILINHAGKNNSEILGANSHAIYFKAGAIMRRIEETISKGKGVNVADIYLDILGPNGLNDAEKCCLFHIICNIMEKQLLVVLVPKEKI